MPRVKAITTGSIPSFLDVILNFAESDTTSSLASQDTWLSQLKRKPGGKLIIPHMIPKQKEMDDIIKQIYEAIETEKQLQSTLLVLCGDHGMNDAGNHGGSAEGETSPALVFLSPKLQTISSGSQSPIILPEGRFNYYTTIEQSDIAPSLAGLLGFPIPLNNLGVFIPPLLSFWDQG
ncbi:hypothetical protein P7C71_g4705, partial [Lecanoromycetidae sp. Uapishka_2]